MKGINKHTLGMIIGLVTLFGFVSCKNRSESNLLSSKQNNGSVVIICDQKLPELGGSDIMIADLYVSRIHAGLKNLKIPKDKNGRPAHYLEIVKEVVERFKPRHYHHYREMKALINQVDPKQNIGAQLYKLELPKVKDKIDLPKTGNCELKYAATQKASNIPNRKTFRFQKEIWNRLDNINKAAVLVHEIFAKVLDPIGKRIHLALGYAFADKMPAHPLKYLRFYDDFLTGRGTTPGRLLFLPEDILPNQDNRQLMENDLEKGLVWIYPEKIDDQWSLTLRQMKVTAPGLSGKSYTTKCGTEKSVLECETELYISKFTKSIKIEEIEINQVYKRGHSDDPGKSLREFKDRVATYLVKDLYSAGLIKLSCYGSFPDETCQVKSMLRWNSRQNAYIYVSPY